MILASIDIEATGLEIANDRIIEMGLVLYSTGQKKILESTGFLVSSDGVKITEEITDITGITQVAVEKFGYPQPDAIDALNEYLSQADAVVGHNITWFDLPMIRETAKRLGVDVVPKLVIDTMTDIPGVKGEQLISMCAKHGFVNPNQHSAEDDAKSVIKLIEGYNIDEIVARAKSPTFVVLSHQDRSAAANKAGRKAGFRWSDTYKVWHKAVKECDYQELANQVPFQISITKDIPLEQLRD